MVSLRPSSAVALTKWVLATKELAEDFEWITVVCTMEGRHLVMPGRVSCMAVTSETRRHADVHATAIIRIPLALCSIVCMHTV